MLLDRRPGSIVIAAPPLDTVLAIARTYGVCTFALLVHQLRSMRQR